jgi:integrase
MGILTALAVKAATAPGRYHDGDGLMLVVQPSGARSWIVRLQVDRRRREFGLGRAADVSLGEARDRAMAIRKQYRDGIDPVAAKRAAAAAQRTIPTFADAAATVFSEHSPAWRNARHRAQWLSSLEAHAFPMIGAVKVDQVDSSMVRAILLPIWLATPETARRVRQRVCMVLDWAHSNGFREHEAPMRSIAKGLPRQPKRDNHMAAMPYADVRAFLASLSAGSPTSGRNAVRFAILTAARSGEVRGATWGEIDLSAATWTIPATRMKAGRAHIVPLSAAAIEVLQSAGDGVSADHGTTIFPGRGGGPVSDMTLTKVLRDAGQPFTVHGFRSAFKDWASEQTAFPDAVSETALAHGDPDRVRKAYRRTDFLAMRRDMMAAWSSYLTANDGNIVQFPGRKAVIS